MVMTRALPTRPVEIGRIRIGWKEPNKSGTGTHPAKLDVWRLTSRHLDVLEYAASHPDIGGNVQEWKDAPGEGHQWELFTKTTMLKVMIPTLMAGSLSFEKWRGTFNVFRCNGQMIEADVDHPKEVGKECPCAEDPPPCGADRVLRLNVHLLDLPGMGVWRFQTGGFYATAELLDTFNRLAEAGIAHTMIEGSLRLEQRTRSKLVIPDAGGKAKPQTHNFVVPVFWPVFTQRELLAGAKNVMIAAPAPKQLPSPSIELFGDPDEIDATLHAARHPGTRHPLEGQIDDLLYNQGRTPERVAQYWLQVRERYADLTPAILTMLKEKIEADTKKRQEATQQPREGTHVEKDASQDTVPTEMPGTPQSMPISWRSALQALLPQMTDLFLRSEIEAHIENPDVEDATGQALLVKVQSSMAVDAETVPPF